MKLLNDITIKYINNPMEMGFELLNMIIKENHLLDSILQGVRDCDGVPTNVEFFIFGKFFPGKNHSIVLFLYC